MLTFVILADIFTLSDQHCVCARSFDAVSAAANIAKSARGVAV
jgi:hypothetical protein